MKKNTYVCTELMLECLYLIQQQHNINSFFDFSHSIHVFLHIISIVIFLLKNCLIPFHHVH